jgi:hypothetical protein
LSSSDSASPTSGKAKEGAEIELRALTPAAADSMPDEGPGELLARIPHLAHALQTAPLKIKRPVFDAFGLQITYDRSAGGSESVADPSRAATH